VGTAGSMVDHQTVSGIPLESCRRKLTLSESWRFVVPIFLHVGIIHLLLNMVAQVTAAAQVEREMGEPDI
jgi:membrane associated rhomboid family serine protease